MAAVVTLKTSDGQSFEVVQAVDFQSPTIMNMEMPNAKSSVLKMTMEFVEKRHQFTRRIEKGDVAGREGLKTWETEFLGVDQNTLIDLVEAAHFLGSKELVEVASRKVADTMKGKSVAELRQLFNIHNDYSREEEEEVKKENPWPFLIIRRQVIHPSASKDGDQ